MSKKPLNISEEAAVQMPMKTVASLNFARCSRRVRIHRADGKVGIIRDIT
jgi:hypothetical protein